jgi:uncharacterized phage protein (TIGR01671 family)
MIYDIRAGRGGWDWTDEHGTDWYLDDDSIMQFVGLKDKHGKEVYEGDIVRAKLAQNPGELVEEVTEVVDIHEGLLAPFYMRVNFEEDWWTDALVDGFEVIGNIYEHPELVPK